MGSYKWYGDKIDDFLGEIATWSIIKCSASATANSCHFNEKKKSNPITVHLFLITVQLTEMYRFPIDWTIRCFIRGVNDEQNSIFKQIHICIVCLYA